MVRKCVKKKQKTTGLEIDKTILVTTLKVKLQKNKEKNQKFL